MKPCFVSGSVTDATLPRRTRLVPIPESVEGHFVHRSTNAARAAYPNLASLIEALHVVFVLSAANLRRNQVEGRGNGGFSTFGTRLHDEGNHGQSLQVRQYCEVLSQAGV